MSEEEMIILLCLPRTEYSRDSVVTDSKHPIANIDPTLAALELDSPYICDMSVGTKSRKEPNTMRAERDTKCIQNAGLVASFFSVARDD
jgi:hypothetical protein